MIPIVIVTTVDPVAAGLIESLARPGGNVTGLTRDLSGKRSNYYLGFTSPEAKRCRVQILLQSACSLDTESPG